ncbi:MAG TPA: esterase-like activity of phytase family protein [Alphaproteobacteria bacterium]|nr:esterase-like activity of phytase family protein [Alphaproteobacteria bacterium]
MVLEKSLAWVWIAPAALCAVASISPSLATQRAALFGPAVTPVAVTAETVPLDPGDPRRTRAGRLDFLGGVVLSSADGRFGGWSDLWIDPTGERLVAISDRGNFLDARLRSDASGAPLVVDQARIGPMIDTRGRRLSGRQTDAEALARTPDGGFIVAFERHHRLAYYPAAEPPFSLPARLLASPPELTRAPANGGIEALAALDGGILLALSEDLVDAGGRVGWVGQPGQWRRFVYVAGQGFKPTGAGLLPGGDMIVVERHFTVLSGLATRLTRLPRAAIRPDARIVGDELARIGSPRSQDNFEGVAARRTAAGTTLIYLLSDDNFSMLLRTVLFVFALVE